MANLVLMPQLGISEDSAILTQWHVKVGDSVKTGDKLFSIETGKSAFDVESEHTGTVLALMAAEGDEVDVKATVCAIGEKDEKVEVTASQPQKTAAANDDLTKPVESVSDSVAARPASSMTAHGVSPRAKKLAEKNDIDSKLASPTGPDGRVIERDVRALLENTPYDHPDAVRHPSKGGESYEDKPLSNMRKVIAKNMMASLQNSAQLTHTASFDATNIMDYRKTLKENAEMSGVTLGDMILYAVARTLPEFPALNAWFMDDKMRYFSEVNLACAVDTEKGLMVPVITGTSNMTLFEISKEIKVLADGCRNGTVNPKLLTGGSFTVSNLGQFGIESFTPILNAPQTGILGVNTITHRVKSDGTVYPCMTLSLTYDHRALDGAPASKFLQTLCKSLEQFTALLAR